MENYIGVRCRQHIFQFYFLDLSAHDDTYLFGLISSFFSFSFEYGYEWESVLKDDCYKMEFPYSFYTQGISVIPHCNIG